MKSCILGENYSFFLHLECIDIKSLIFETVLLLLVFPLLDLSFTLKCLLLKTDLPSFLEYVLRA